MGLGGDLPETDDVLVAPCEIENSEQSENQAEKADQSDGDLTSLLLVVVPSENADYLVPGDQVVEVVGLAALGALLEFLQFDLELPVELGLIVGGEEDQVFLLLFFDGEFIAEFDELLALLVDLAEVLPRDVQEEEQQFLCFLVGVGDQVSEVEQEQNADQNAPAEEDQTHWLGHHGALQFLVETLLDLPVQFLVLKIDLREDRGVVIGEVEYIEGLVLLFRVQVIGHSGDRKLY